MSSLPFRRRRPARASAPLLALGALFAATLPACTVLPPWLGGAPAPAAALPAPPPPPTVTAPAPPPPPPALRPVEAEPRAPATQMQPQAPGPLGSMLAHADRVRGLSAAELSAEIARLNEAATASGGHPAMLMQQALALAQTRNPADLARALGLVQRVAADGSDAGRPLQPLARLLAARYQEQRRVEDERDRQGQQFREAQRRIDQLNDRLEALRAIERSFGRPAPAAPPNGGAPRAAPH